METIRRQINLGAEICQLIKQESFPNTPWVKVHQKVAQMFSRLKKSAIIFYPDRDLNSILMELRKWKGVDLIELIENVPRKSS